MVLGPGLPEYCAAGISSVCRRPESPEPPSLAHSPSLRGTGPDSTARQHTFYKLLVRQGQIMTLPVYENSRVLKQHMKINIKMLHAIRLYLGYFFSCFVRLEDNNYLVDVGAFAEMFMVHLSEPLDLANHYLGYTGTPIKALAKC